MYKVHLVDGSCETIDSETLIIRQEPGIPESSIELRKKCVDPVSMKEVNELVFFAPLISIISIQKI